MAEGGSRAASAKEMLIIISLCSCMFSVSVFFMMSIRAA